MQDGTKKRPNKLQETASENKDSNSIQKTEHACIDQRALSGESKRKDKFIWRIEKTEPSKKIAQEIARDWGITKNLLRRKQTEPDNWELTYHLWNRRGIVQLWVSSWLKIQDLQNKVNSLTDARDFFYDPETAGQLRNWHRLLADWDQEILWNTGNGWDEFRRVLQYQPHVLLKILEPWSLCIILEELILKMVWWITRDIRSRNCILAKFLDSLEFQS